VQAGARVRAPWRRVQCPSRRPLMVKHTPPCRPGFESFLRHLQQLYGGRARAALAAAERHLAGVATWVVPQAGKAMRCAAAAVCLLACGNHALWTSCRFMLCTLRVLPCRHVHVGERGMQWAERCRGGRAGSADTWCCGRPGALLQRAAHSRGTTTAAGCGAI
jgi:hypothetical protein